MNRTLGHPYIRSLIVATAVSWQLWNPGGHIAVAGSPGVTLFADNVQHTVTVQPGEAVKLRAVMAGGLPKGEFIAIVNGKQLVGKPCSSNPCVRSASYDSPHTADYQALVYTTAKSIEHSGTITVSWKSLRVLLKVTSAVRGTFQKVSKEPLVVSQLAGVPLTLNVSTPDGVATSWSHMQVVSLDSNQLVEPCAPDRCQLKVHVVDKPVTYLVKEINDKGVEEKVVGPLTIQPRDWAVTLEATGKNGKSDTSLGADPNEQVALTASISEPNPQLLRQYAYPGITVEQNGGTSILKECSQVLTCSDSVAKPEGTSLSLHGTVFALDELKKLHAAGTSAALTVNWRTPDLGIIYRITGGNPDCTPPPAQSGPLQGYTECYPHAGSTVEFTAWAVTHICKNLNDCTDTPTSLPSGWRIEWNEHPGDRQDCTNGRYANPCKLMVTETAKGGIQFNAWIDDASNQIVQTVTNDSYVLNVFWE